MGCGQSSDVMLTSRYRCVHVAGPQAGGLAGHVPGNRGVNGARVHQQRSLLDSAAVGVVMGVVTGGVVMQFHHNNKWACT